MAKNEVTILLELLDLDYLKPILVDRFKNINVLASANLAEIGIENQDHLTKLQYALDELQHTQICIETMDPVISFNDCNQIITRLENESNLISSGLNLLLNNSSKNLPKDDATCDIDYSLYNSKIDQIAADIEQLQDNTDELVKEIVKKYRPSEQSSSSNRNNANQNCLETFAILTLSIFCIGLVFSIKHQ
ncbi:unnamed protein product [Rotaria socialis]|uniref:Uncharacterized protein n=1 Tax=Rotaria socialis TaxID=392032 RepID=A0A820C2W8_9BILA|nr:unnamed protein product [Rotaria socialis]CAF3439267.1 unnamed protein product [Rotaria socialis]CAF3540509.1 unnamed protein product [Rotaria socialis]CAF4177721.1 unnamed protein product [Rotaria socialis]CAF4215278.1 unnamed protein product [Rotaria socialis]